MLVNRSKTVDVTEVTITHKDYPTVEFQGRPRHLTTKAQYLRPSDQEYTVRIIYNDLKTGETGKEISPSVIVSTPLPRESYYLYIYRTKDGIVIADKDKDKDPDLEDTGNPDPDTDEGDGTIPGVVPEKNRNKIGVFVVLNMTRSQNIDKVRFARADDPSLGHTMHSEPKAGDQQSIGLKQGSWPVTAYYTPPSGTQTATSTKNGVVMPMNDPMSLRTNFMYFYKKKASAGGGFDITPIWPPVPNDADEGGNYTEEDMLGDGQGILRITNKSETGKVLKGIMIDTTENEVTMVKDDVLKFILGVGTVNVAFRPQGQSFYGLTIPREIKERKITDLSYYDNLGNPDDLPPDAGFGSGLIKIINNSTGVVTGANIVNPDDVTGPQMFKPSSSFTPPIPINYNKTGRVAIVGTGAFPLVPAKIYRIQVAVQAPSGGEKVVEKNAVIRDQIVEIKINQKDLEPGESTYGAKVTIQNNVSGTTVYVTKMEVYSAAMPNYSAVCGSSSFTPSGNISNGTSAHVTVTGVLGLPIIQGQTYKARLTVVSSNGRTAVVVKDFSPDGYLYGDPASNNKTVTLVNGNLPPDLLEPFVPVTDITLGSSTVNSTVLQATDQLVTAGTLVLNNVTFAPSNATHQNITWSIQSPATTWVSLDGSRLMVIKGKTAPGTQTVQVTATIPNGTSPGTDYTKNFTITLQYTRVEAAANNPVTGLWWLRYNITELALRVGDTFDLRDRVLLVTANGQPPYWNGRPVTHDDLVFSKGAGSAVSLSSTNNRIVTANAVGTGIINVTLPANVGNTGVISTELPLSVTVREGGTGIGINVNIMKVNNSGKSRPSDFNRAVVTRWYNLGENPYDSGTYLSGKTGITWDDQPGLTGEDKLVAKLEALGADFEVKYNLEPDGHQINSQGIAAGGGWWTHTEGVTTRRSCDIWFVDKAHNVYGYLEGANISPATNKVLHLHLIGGVTNPALGGGVWNIHVNTNVDSPQWGNVQIVRVNPNL